MARRRKLVGTEREEFLCKDDDLGVPAKEVGRNEDRYEANTYNYVTTSNTNSIHRYGIYGNTIELGFSDWGLGGF